VRDTDCRIESEIVSEYWAILAGQPREETLSLKHHSGHELDACGEPAAAGQMAEFPAEGNGRQRSRRICAEALDRGAESGDVGAGLASCVRRHSRNIYRSSNIAQCTTWKPPQIAERGILGATASAPLTPPVPPGCRTGCARRRSAGRSC